MSNIPEPNLPPARPRRSSFATATPVTPAPSNSSQKPTTETMGRGEGSEPTPPSSPPDPKPTAAKSTRRTVAEATTPNSPAPRPPASAKRSPAFSRDILLSVSDEQKARLENTQAWTAPRTGVKSQQAFIRWGIDELCSRLEQEYNDGKPFDPIPGQAE